MSHHVIRHASEEDEPALRRLADLSRQPPVRCPALVGEIGGNAVAAVSLTDGRVVSDPAEPAGGLTEKLLQRARLIRALHVSPALRAQLVAALRA